MQYPIEISSTIVFLYLLIGYVFAKYVNGGFKEELMYDKFSISFIFGWIIIICYVLFVICQDEYMEMKAKKLRGCQAFDKE